MNMDGSATGVSHAEGPCSVNMDGTAGGVSNAEGPRSVNMDVSAASVSHVEGPRSANMDDGAARVRHAEGSRARRETSSEEPVSARQVRLGLGLYGFEGTEVRGEGRPDAEGAP